MIVLYGPELVTENHGQHSPLSMGGLGHQTGLGAHRVSQLAPLDGESFDL